MTREREKETLEEKDPWNARPPESTECRREYPHRPLVGVGATVFDGDRVLLIQRGRDPARGKWSLPGGLVKLGESLEEAVRREVKEETGIHVRPLDLVACLDRVIRDAEGRIAYHYVLLDFLCEPLAGEPTPGSDVTDCRYVPLDRLSSLDLTRGTLRVVFRAEKRRRQNLPSLYDPAL